MTISSIRYVHQVAVDRSRLNALRQRALNPPPTPGKRVSYMQKIPLDMYEAICFYLPPKEVMQTATCCNYLRGIVKALSPRALLENYIPGLPTQLEERFGRPLDWHTALRGYLSSGPVIRFPQGGWFYDIGTSKQMHLLWWSPSSELWQGTGSFQDMVFRTMHVSFSWTPVPKEQSVLEFIGYYSLESTKHICLKGFRSHFRLQFDNSTAYFPRNLGEGLLMEEGCVIRKNNLGQLEWFSIYQGSTSARTCFIRAHRCSIKDFNDITIEKTYYSEVIGCFPGPQQEEDESCGRPIYHMELRPNSDELYVPTPSYRLFRFNPVTKRTSCCDVQVQRPRSTIVDLIRIKFITHSWFIIGGQKTLFLCQIVDSNQKDTIIARYQLQIPWKCNNDGNQRQLAIESIGTQVLVAKTPNAIASWRLPNLDREKPIASEKGLPILKPMWYSSFDGYSSYAPLRATPCGLFAFFSGHEQDTLLLRIPCT